MTSACSFFLPPSSLLPLPLSSFQLTHTHPSHHILLLILVPSSTARSCIAFNAPPLPPLTPPTYTHAHSDYLHRASVMAPDTHKASGSGIGSTILGLAQGEEQLQVVN